MKVAVYLDELDNDPIKACVRCRSLGIKFVCLRRVWSTNIARATDAACQKLVSALANAKLEVAAIHTDIGQTTPVDQLEGELAAFDRALLIARYFKAGFVRVYTGRTIRDDMRHLDTWMEKISTAATNMAVTPLLELDTDSTLQDPADAATMLSRYTHWKILYDPASLIVKQANDPYEKYWLLLEPMIAAVDLHDFSKQLGFVLAGHGDGQWAKTFRRMVDTGFDGWCFIEPGFPRRHGVMPVKHVSVQKALDRYQELLNAPK